MVATQRWDWPQAIARSLREAPGVVIIAEASLEYQPWIVSGSGRLEAGIKSPGSGPTKAGTPSLLGGEGRLN